MADARRAVRKASHVRALFWVALLFISAAITEVGAYLVELASPYLMGEPIRRRSAILSEQSERIASLLGSTRARREVLDSLLGWRYRSGYASETEHINLQGLRSRREYAPRAATGTLRVAAFGDSFVYGHEVADHEAWCAVLEAGSANLEALNYGVGGYGLDQAFLRFQKEGLALAPDVVLIVFVPDDLRRMVNVYRRFISSRESPLTKPRFVLREDTTLVLVTNPFPRREDYQRLLADPASIRELGPLDAWYSATIYEHPMYDWIATLRVGHAVGQRTFRRFVDPDRLLRGDTFNPQSEAFEVQVAVFRAFEEAAQQGNAHPVMLMLPDRPSVEYLREGEPPVYAPLRDELRRQGATVWDGGEAFDAARNSIDELFAPGGHYSAIGNRTLAAWLAPRLESVRSTLAAGNDTR